MVISSNKQLSSERTKSYSPKILRILILANNLRGKTAVLQGKENENIMLVGEDTGQGTWIVGRIDFIRCIVTDISKLCISPNPVKSYSHRKDLIKKNLNS